MEELASECPVNDNHTLRVRTVRIGERSACQHRNLQRIEIARGDIHLICRNLPSRLLAVVEGDCIEQGTLIRQGQSDGCILHAGNFPHGGEALIEQLSESGQVVISGIIQRRLGGNHSVWIETWRHGLQVDERAAR